MTFSQPFQREVVDYRPTIDKVNQLGHQFDAVIREVDQPLQSRPHNRSTLTDTGRRSRIPDDQRSVDCKYLIVVRMVSLMLVVDSIIFS